MMNKMDNEDVTLLEIIDFENRVCKVVKAQTNSVYTIGEIVVIVDGPSLVNYKDCGQVKFILKKENGTTLVETVDGFTCDCTEETRLRWPNPSNDPSVGLGIPSFRIAPKGTTDK